MLKPNKKFLIAFMFFVGSCASQEEIAQQANRRRIELETIDNRTCISYGFKFGSPDYANCRLNIASQRNSIEAADEQQRRAAALGIMQMQNYNNQMNAQRLQQVGQQNMQMFNRPTVNTNCYGYGNSINCTSIQQPTIPYPQ